MDVHDKLDEISALVEGARAMPMSASCVVNRGQLLDLLDEARGLLPTSLAHADDVLADRETIMARAQADAQDVLDQARAQAQALVADHEIYQAALAEADHLRAEASELSTRMRHETDDYVDAKLARFEVALQSTLDAVATGREKIRGRQEYEELGPDDAPLPS